MYSNTVYIKLASFPFTASLIADTNRKIEIPHKPQNSHSKMLPSTIYSYFPSYHCPWQSVLNAKFEIKVLYKSVHVQHEGSNATNLHSMHIENKTPVPKARGKDTLENIKTTSEHLRDFPKELTSSVRSPASN